MEFSSSKLKNFLYFRKKLPRPQKKKKGIKTLLTLKVLKHYPFDKLIT